MKIQKLRNVTTPSRGTKMSAGLDFYIPFFDNNFIKDFLTKNPNLSVNLENKTISLGVNERVLIPSGIRVEIPENRVLIGFNKSGIASSLGLLIGAQVIDEDYRGEIHINVINTSSSIVTIEEGKKLVQFLLQPIDYCDIEVVDKISTNTERKTGGFGSTGEK